MPYVCGEFGKTLAEHMLIAFQLADGGIRKRFYVKPVMCKRDNRIVHAMVQKDARNRRQFPGKILR